MKKYSYDFSKKKTSTLMYKHCLSQYTTLQYEIVVTQFNFFPTPY